ncbi:MAG: hypothetical protein ABFS42_04805 [Candidatus Krumholzibacteriota bacterium]
MFPASFPRTLNRAASRLLLTAAVVLAVWPADGRASSTRIGSLGGSGGFFEDHHNVLRWYGSLGDYPDLVIIETGHFDLSDGYDDDWGRTVSGPGGGVHARFDKNGRWGTGGLFFHGLADDSDPGSLHDGYRGGSVTALYARDIAGLSVGFMFRHTADTDFQSAAPSPDPVERTFEQTRNDFGFGLRMDISPQAYLDLAGEIRHLRNRAFGSDPADPDWDTSDLDSWNNQGLRARAFIGLNDRLALAPLVEYVHEDFTGTSHAGGDLVGETSGNRGHLFRVGAGLNLFVDADNLLLFSTEHVTGRVDHTIRDLDGDSSYSWREDYGVLLLRLAFETRLAHWVTARASAGYEHVDNQGDNRFPETGEHIPLGLGLGLHLGSLSVDLGLTDREPRGLSRYSAALTAADSSTWLAITLGYGF